MINSMYPFMEQFDFARLLHLLVPRVLKKSKKRVFRRQRLLLLNPQYCYTRTPRGGPPRCNEGQVLLTRRQIFDTGWSMFVEGSLKETSALLVKTMYSDTLSHFAVRHLIGSFGQNTLTFNLDTIFCLALPRGESSDGVFACWFR